MKGIAFDDLAPDVQDRLLAASGERRTRKAPRLSADRVRGLALSVLGRVADRLFDLQSHISHVLWAVGWVFL